MINRQPFVDNFSEIEDLGEQDELPILPEDTDPQVYASKITVPQPFYLVCGKDSLLVILSGKAEIKFKHPDLNRFKAVAGDFVYVPARTPHRIVPLENVMLNRYKARESGKESVIWYCDTCGEALHSHSWDNSIKNAHSQYSLALNTFNASNDLRTCHSCGSKNEPQLLDGNRWDSIADQLQGVNK